MGYLSPDADVAILVDKLQTDPRAGHTLYIGHLPYLDQLVSTLISGNEGGCHVQFQNSGVICLQQASTLFQIRWYLTPELLPVNLPA